MENIKKAKQKSPKFKESYDEEFSWEDEKDRQTRRRKLGKKSQWKENIKEKWSSLTVDDSKK